MRTDRTKVFISYSHKDRSWLDKILVHLKPLIREGQMQIWVDTAIRSGANWREEIKVAIETAKVAILLVSADFLASDFIMKDELPPLLKAAREEGAIIIPVIIGPCRYYQTESISQFQAINDPSKSLKKMSGAERDDIYVALTERVIEALDLDNNRSEQPNIRIDGEGEKAFENDDPTDYEGGVRGLEKASLVPLKPTAMFSFKPTKRQLLIPLVTLLISLLIYYSFPHKQEVEVMVLNNKKASVFGGDLEIIASTIGPDDNQNYKVSGVISSRVSSDFPIHQQGVGYAVTYEGVNTNIVEIVGIEPQRIRFLVTRKKWGITGW